MKPPGRLDHLVLAAPTLAAGVRRVRALLGVKPEPGGSHPRWATRNALVGLGPGRYLEVIAPDPELPAPDGPRPFRIDALERPELVSWALKDDRPERSAERLAAVGVDAGAVLPGRRRKPDGTVLSWRLSDPAADREGGALPFLIDWTGAAHPAHALEHRVSLTGFRIRHPDPERVRRALLALEVEASVVEASAPGLLAELETRDGRVELT